MLQAPACGFCVLMESEDPLPGRIPGQGRGSERSRSSGHSAGTLCEVASFLPPRSKPAQTPPLAAPPLQDPHQVPGPLIAIPCPELPQRPSQSSEEPVPVSLSPARLSRGSARPGPAAVGLSPAGRAAGQASRWLLHPSLRSPRGRRAEREREQEPCPARRHERRQR